MKQRFGLDCINYLGDAVEKAADWFEPKPDRDAVPAKELLIAIELRQREIDAMITSLRQQVEGR